jgi:hypothetical protein
MSQPRTTIQINSLEALERLIGNDTELEMDIRRNIVEEFCKRHLKTLAAAIPLEVITLFKREIQLEMWSQVEKQYPHIVEPLDWGNTSRLTLKPEAITKAVEETKHLVTNHFKRIADQFTDETTKKYIEDRIEEYIAKGFEVKIRGAIRKMITEEITAAFAEIGKPK